MSNFTEEQLDKVNEAILSGVFGVKEGQTQTAQGPQPFRMVDSSIFKTVRSMPDEDVLAKVTSFFIDKKIKLQSQLEKLDSQKSSVQAQIDSL